MKARNKKGAAPAAHASGPDLDEVRRILLFMEQHNLEEFEYENGNFRVRLRKAGSHSSPVFRAVPPAPEIVVARAAPPASPGSTSAAGGGALATEPIPDNLHVIKSPIVGTFYASPTPGAEAFVRVGDQVNSGQVL